MCTEVKQYFYWNPFTPLAAQVFSNENFAYIRKKINELCPALYMSDEDIYNGLLEQYDKFAYQPTFAISSALACSESLNMVNNMFLQRQKQYADENVCMKQLYNKYFCGRQYNGSMIVAPYPTMALENYNTKNTRGFSFEELALKKNDANSYLVSKNSYGLTNPANRFVQDYRTRYFGPCVKW